MNKLTAFALLVAFVAAWSYSAGKRSAKPMPQASKPAEQPTRHTSKTRNTVVDVQPLPTIRTRMTGREKADIYFAEAIRANAEKRTSNGNR